MKISRRTSKRYRFINSLPALLSRLFDGYYYIPVEPRSTCVLNAHVVVHSILHYVLLSTVFFYPICMMHIFGVWDWHLLLGTGVMYEAFQAITTIPIVISLLVTVLVTGAAMAFVMVHIIDYVFTWLSSLGGSSDTYMRVVEEPIQWLVGNVGEPVVSWFSKLCTPIDYTE